MAMVGVDAGSLYRRTHSLSRLAWSWVGGRLAPFYIHQMNQVNSRNGCAIDDSTINIVLDIILLLLYLLTCKQRYLLTVVTYLRLLLTYLLPNFIPSSTTNFI